MIGSIMIVINYLLQDFYSDSDLFNLWMKRPLAGVALYFVFLTKCTMKIKLYNQFHGFKFTFHCYTTGLFE